jgi:dolichol-phosphate mannosyltransferase
MRRGYEWLITMDCDEQHEPAHLPEFLAAAAMDSGDVISGSRYLQTLPGNGKPPAERRRINAYVTGLINERLGLQLTDAFCGFKAYRVSALAGLRLTESGYAFPMQFWAEAAGNGLRVTELPVRLVYPDANRNFGGDIDDPQIRLRYYLRVLDAAMKAAGHRLGGGARTDSPSFVNPETPCRCP